VDRYVGKKKDQQINAYIYIYIYICVCVCVCVCVCACVYMYVSVTQNYQGLGVSDYTITFVVYTIILLHLLHVSVI
jgi:hypothetical protein